MAIRRTEDTGAGAISTSHAATGNEELISVNIMFDSAPSTSEDLTITFNSKDGAEYDVILALVDPAVEGASSILWYPDEPQMLEILDSIDVAFTNTDARTWTVAIITQSTAKFVTEAQRSLSEVMMATAKLLGGYRMSLATGGTVSEVVDTKRAENDDFFNQGTLFIIDTVGDDAPIGEFAEVSSFVQSTGVFTLVAGLTNVVSNGDRYGIIASYPPDMIIEAINLVLLGVPYAMNDDLSVVVADNQSEYELPTHISAMDVKHVYMQTNVDTNDNLWSELYNWEPYTMGPGKNDLLKLPSGMSSGTVIRVNYVTRPKPMYDYSDYIDKSIPMERLIYRAAAFILMERYGQSTGNETLQVRINYLFERADDADAQYQRGIPHKQAKIMKW